MGFGGFFGAICRYGLSSWLTRALREPAFPVGILLVNLLGCLAIGVAFGLAEARDWFVRDTRLFLFAGFLGGFTTFSTFGYDTFILIRSGQFAFAVLNVLASVLLGVAAVWAGFRCVCKWTG